jgi:polyketide synthase PksJ
MGYMTSSLDPVSQDFVQFSSKRKLPSLDIGAAYGVATRAALSLGATVISNDIDPRHLELIQENLPASDLNRFKKLPGDILEIGVNHNSISSILACRVLHFFKGEKIETAAEKFYNWLEKGGRVFVVCETPYLKNFSNFIPEFEARKRLNHAWPGFIDDVAKIAPERAPFLPKEIHLLDPDTLSRVFEKVGFRTIKSETMARPDFPIDIQLDGRESVGYIGEK